MNYTDKDLQNHELNYWLHHNSPNKHADFYQEFFNFSLLSEKEVLDVGCGGNPITDFLNYNIKLSILDPLIDSLTSSGKYDHLLNFPRYSLSLLDFQEENKFDVITCLNVIDHFNDDDFKFVDIFYNALKNNGELWLYYDVRPVDSCDHLALNHPGIIQRISEKFNITKISESINPKHNGWSGITSSIRLVAIKK